MGDTYGVVDAKDKERMGSRTRTRMQW